MEKVVFEKPKSGITSISLRGQKFQHLLENLEKGKEIYFSGEMVGKTLIKTVVYCGDYASIHDLDIDGFSMYERLEEHPFLGAKYVNHFKITKKQPLEKYKDFILGTVALLEEKLGHSINQETFKVITAIDVS